MDEDERKEEREEIKDGEPESADAPASDGFEETRRLIEELDAKIEELKGMVLSVKDGMSVFVENGATIKESADEEAMPDAVEFDTDGDVSELVYALDDLDLDM